MPILGNAIKRLIRVRSRVKWRKVSPLAYQQKVLKRLLTKAEHTAFGHHYGFGSLLDAGDIQHAFRKRIPIHDYNKIYEEWWQHALNGEQNVCWPGRTKYFALSSGTSESSSKRIPITSDQIKTIKRASIKQILTLANYDLPSRFFEKGILMIGGSTNLNRKGHYFEGDLSGISAKKIPFWFNHFYKPGRKISKERDWEKKIEEIVEQAHKWDISIIVGVPAWVQIILEKIVEHYQLKNIHELWPNLGAFVHAGVSIEPYRKGFEKLFGKTVFDCDTYLASEGFIAFQENQQTQSMRMLMNNSIYYEFVPFDENNFDNNGDIKEAAKALHIGEVMANQEYALLLSTCAGAWRYLIGDVIKFTNVERAEILITGRTKHYLSLTGEHLSIDNMNKAINAVEAKMNLRIDEFAVAGVPHQNLFAHQWYIGSDTIADESVIAKIIDEKLCEVNDDYAVERTSALKEISVRLIPNDWFYEWLKLKGKSGGQHKFPRVLKGNQLNDWEDFLSKKKLTD